MANSQDDHLVRQRNLPSKIQCRPNEFQEVLNPIFQGLRIFIHSAVNATRRRVLRTLITKYAGTNCINVGDGVTHILADESATVEGLREDLKWKNSHVQYLVIGWVSACIRENKLLTHSSFQIASTRSPALSVQHGSSNSDVVILETVEASGEGNGYEPHHFAKPSFSKAFYINPDNAQRKFWSPLSEGSTFEDLNYNGETTCDDEWLFLPLKSPEPIELSSNTEDEEYEDEEYEDEEFENEQMENKETGEEKIEDKNLENKEVEEIEVIEIEDEEIGDEEIGDEEIGDEEIGDKEIGDEEIGDEEIRDEEIGDKNISDEIADEKIEDQEMEVEDWEDKEVNSDNEQAMEGNESKEETDNLYFSNDSNSNVEVDRKTKQVNNDYTTNNDPVLPASSNVNLPVKKAPMLPFDKRPNTTVGRLSCIRLRKKHPEVESDATWMVINFNKPPKNKKTAEVNNTQEDCGPASPENKLPSDTSDITDRLPIDKSHFSDDSLKTCTFSTDKVFQQGHKRKKTASSEEQNKAFKQEGQAIPENEENSNISFNKPISLKKKKRKYDKNASDFILSDENKDASNKKTSALQKKKQKKLQKIKDKNVSAVFSSGKHGITSNKESPAKLKKTKSKKSKSKKTKSKSATDRMTVQELSAYEEKVLSTSFSTEEKLPHTVKRKNNLISLPNIQKESNYEFTASGNALLGMPDEKIRKTEQKENNYSHAFSQNIISSEAQKWPEINLSCREKESIIQIDLTSNSSSSINVESLKPISHTMQFASVASTTTVEELPLSHKNLDKDIFTCSKVSVSEVFPGTSKITSEVESGCTIDDLSGLSRSVVTLCQIDPQENSSIGEIKKISMPISTEPSSPNSFSSDFPSHVSAHAKVSTASQTTCESFFSELPTVEKISSSPQEFAEQDISTNEAVCTQSVLSLVNAGVSPKLPESVENNNLKESVSFSVQSLRKSSLVSRSVIQFAKSTLKNDSTPCSDSHMADLQEFRKPMNEHTLDVVPEIVNGEVKSNIQKLYQSEKNVSLVEVTEKKFTASTSPTSNGVKIAIEDSHATLDSKVDNSFSSKIIQPEESIIKRLATEAFVIDGPFIVYMVTDSDSDSSEDDEINISECNSKLGQELKENLLKPGSLETNLSLVNLSHLVCNPTFDVDVRLAELHSTSKTEVVIDEMKFLVAEKKRRNKEEVLKFGYWICSDKNNVNNANHTKLIPGPKSNLNGTKSTSNEHRSLITKDVSGKDILFPLPEPAPLQEISVPEIEFTDENGTSTIRYLSPECPNYKIIEKLQVLYTFFKKAKDIWRIHAYEKAIFALGKYPTLITSLQEAQSINGIGRKISFKIMEIAHTGDLKEIKEFCTREWLSTRSNLTKGWGINDKFARQLYKEKLFTAQLAWEFKGLTRSQRLGLKYYTSLSTKMTRAEAVVIADVIKGCFRSVSKKIHVEACSTIRRNKKRCGHVSILVILDKKVERGHRLLDDAVASMHNTGFLVDDLIRHEENGNQCKFTGIVRVNKTAKFRRIEITLVPPLEYPFARLFLTGPSYFLRAMVKFAERSQMVLDEHCLRVRTLNEEGDTKHVQKVHLSSEKEIFTMINLAYRTPEERNVIPNSTFFNVY